MGLSFTKTVVTVATQTALSLRSESYLSPSSRLFLLTPYFVHLPRDMLKTVAVKPTEAGTLDNAALYAPQLIAKR